MEQEKNKSDLGEEMPQDLKDMNDIFNLFLIALFNHEEVKNWKESEDPQIFNTFKTQMEKFNEKWTNKVSTEIRLL